MKTVYTDSTEEYRALRGSCGLVDHEGTGLVLVSGPQATAFLGQVSTRSVDFLLEGQSSAALLLSGTGVLRAEVLIHCRENGYLVEIWPAQASQARAHLATAAESFAGVTVEDVTESCAVFGLEGPDSFRIVGNYLPFPISSMAYRSGVATSWRDGVPILLSRTGVTGEYGYKLQVPAEYRDALRAELLAAGAVACGLDALDICRMEMRFVNLEREGAPLQGEGAGLTPFHFGLQWMVDFDHEFTGRQALLAHWEAGLGTLPVCWVADPEPDADPTSGDAVSGDGALGSGLTLTVGGNPVGRVAHAVYSPTLGRVIGTARVDRAVAGSGLSYELGGTGRAVHTVSAPFMVATSFGIPLE